MTLDDTTFDQLNRLDQAGLNAVRAGVANELRVRAAMFEAGKITHRELDASSRATHETLKAMPTRPGMTREQVAEEAAAFDREVTLALDEQSAR